MCVIIAALSLIILNSLHHEVVGTMVNLSSHHRSYSHIISIYNTTLHYTILTCSSSCVDGSSSGSSGGSSDSGGSESCIIILYIVMI